MDKRIFQIRNRLHQQIKSALYLCLCFSTMSQAQESYPVYQGSDIVGYLRAETLFDCDSCYTLDTLDVLGRSVVVRLDVNLIGGINEKSIFSNDIEIYDQLKLNRNEVRLRFNSVVSGNMFELYFRKKNGMVYIYRKQWFYPRSFSYREIAEGDYSSFQCTHICNKVINKKIEGPIIFSDIFFGEPSDDTPENCFDCPSQYSWEECLEMKAKNKEFIWEQE